ncbi:Amidohydrolase 3 [Candidatus Koribacter versatilis Ellin345]|uniref:Amidohydrolase 3 n=1 Tax=Koribacter versatilis (strain Ellin345) TaxID=204669 RepID=Q1IRQ7_KORVE|nr:amidohydrolase [Candidatus Koribacter versatilis]ABF40443.1 Amidohydrolase 3 [Candidatus Koribacter versatilis Ellin345]
MKRELLAVLLTATALMAADKKENKSAPQEADAIYYNANVYVAPSKAAAETQSTHDENTAKPSSPAPRPRAFAVKDGKFLAIGTDKEIWIYKGKKTTLVDLKGQFVMPGFNDAHVHLGDGGREMLNVELAGTKSLDEMKQRIAERVKSAAPGEWILGGGWDQTKWTENKLPTRKDLDAVTAGHPAFFDRADGHIAVANSAAITAAKVDKSTTAPAGGAIDHDAKGEPTGIFREGAKGLISSIIPPPTPTQRRKGIELALEDAAQHGITSLQDNSPWEDFLVYEELESEGKLTARIAEWLPFTAELNTLDQHRSHHPGSDPMLHTTMLKGFMDGSLGSRTAALQRPYEDDPTNKGLPQFDQETLNKLADERIAAGYQLGFHAIGDEGVQMALDAFAEAQRYLRDHNQNGRDLHDLRFRIEHSQVLSSDQFQRYKELGVIASMQPNHLLTDMNWALDRLGTARARYSYAWRDFLDAGVPLAFGTDYPVEPITPFRGLYAAVTRQNEAMNREFFPVQKITIDEAIAAYTEGAAYAQFEESLKGRIAPGMYADFVVLDRDITDIRPHDILGTQVLRTVVGGKTVYEVE